MLQNTDLVSSKRMAENTQGVRLFQIFTFYENYIVDFYSARPELLNAPYAEQMQALYEDGFGVFHVYAPYLTNAGVPSEWVIANCEPTQKRWAWERDIPFRPDRWKEDILKAQIERFNPTILYTLDPLEFDSKFTRSLAKRPELVVGWRAALIPDSADWSDFDLIVSHLSICREQALTKGAKHSEFFHPSLPASIRSIAEDISPTYDVVFSGQWTPDHGSRNELIKRLAEAADKEGFSLGLYLCSHHFELPEIVKRFNQGPRWGKAMYRALKSGRIVVNAEIDLAKGDAGNLRLFEATAVGSFLLTEHQRNIEFYFDPRQHIDTYSSPEEMIKKIKYYIGNDGERARKAKAAQDHVFQQFGMEVGSEELISMLSKYLKLGRKATKELGEHMPQMMVMERVIDEALHFLKGSQANRALEIIENVSDLNDVVRDFYHVKAICLVQLSRLEEAAEVLERELKAFPDNRPAQELLQDVYNDIGAKTRPGGTLKAFGVPNMTIPPIQPPIQSLDEMAAEAMRLLQSGDGASALKIAESIAAISPSTPGVNYLKMVCLNAVGRHEEALVAAEKELLINPTHQGARAQYDHLSQALKKKFIPPLNPEQRPYSSKLDTGTLNSIQNATHNYTYRGVPMIKNPFDFALYPLLLWNVKPKTIIEIGSKNGGSALWFGDLMDNYGIDGHIYSLDIVKVTDVSHKRVTFMEANGRKLSDTIKKEWMDSLPRPILVIEDADHSYETSIGVLNFFHPYLKGSEYIVVEDGIISDLEKDPSCNSGPHRALKEFIAAHPGEYDIDSQYADYFGYNFTWCTNGFLRKKKYPINLSVPKDLVRDFLIDDPVPYGLDSQMSANERFQLYSAVRTLIPRREKSLRIVEIGSHAGASLKLQHTAARRDGRPLSVIAVEPFGEESFYKVATEIGATHIKAFSHAAVPAVRDLISSDGVRPEIIMVDGDHSYEGVRQDALDYYEFLAPGGVIVFHDYLPSLDNTNREAIFFHHGGKEPGIRRACIEIMEEKFGATPIELPLLYPTDPTQTQPHLPEIPGVFSTIRIYRKPA